MPNRTPSADALRFAAEWLRHYEDEQDRGVDEARANAVADWLDDQAEASELRAAAREHGVPVARLRSALKAG